VKRLRPRIKTILGGPQASVVDEATLKSFQFVDFVLRGEADDTLGLLLDILSGKDTSTELEKIPGITFRQGNNIVRNPESPIVDNLDRLPLPAFDLDPNFSQRGGAHLELGRGCPYACTFCSTNDFFRRNFRLKSSQTMIEQMKYIKETYGVYNFSLVHDMFTIDRKRVVEFCEALLDCEDKFMWSCSARTDRVDDELLTLMAEAGCDGIFFGIETGSIRMQKIINKNLDLSDASKRIQCADRNKISTAVALITAFPEETKDDLRDTIHYFVDSLRFDHAEPQISLLAPLAKTPIHMKYQDQLIFDHIYSDMSHQGWRQDPIELEMIQAYPDIFPNFYAVPTLELDRRYFKDVRDFVVALDIWFRWLPVALLQDSGDLLAVFDRWKIWWRENSLKDSGPKAKEAPYHYRRQFAEEFLDFVQSIYVNEMATAPAIISTIIKGEGVSWKPDRQSEHASDFVSVDEDFSLDSFPYRPESLHVLNLDLNYQEIIQCLRNKQDFKRVSQQSVAIVFQPVDRERVDVRQLTPLSTELWRMCNGNLTVSDISHKFSLLKTDFSGIPMETVCIFGLRELIEQKLVRMSSYPVEEKAMLSDKFVMSNTPDLPGSWWSRSM
jgi:radical SAM superfamily enzyme YgiQ (UPF0313 family)